MSGIGADSAGLVQERGTDDFSIGLVFDEVIRVFGDRKTGIVADFAEFAVNGAHHSIGKATLWGGGGGLGGLGGSGVVSGIRHLIE